MAEHRLSCVFHSDLQETLRGKEIATDLSWGLRAADVAAWILKPLRPSTLKQARRGLVAKDFVVRFGGVFPLDERPLPGARWYFQ